MAPRRSTMARLLLHLLPLILIVSFFSFLQLSGPAGVDRIWFLFNYNMLSCRTHFVPHVAAATAKGSQTMLLGRNICRKSDRNVCPLRAASRSKRQWFTSSFLGGTSEPQGCTNGCTFQNGARGGSGGG